jgi:hypothetical protein
MGMTLSRYVMAPVLLLAGSLFSWRLLGIPSRLETTAFLILLFLIPTLKYPKFGVYYLFGVSLFIPLFRRMYYLVAERPALDYLMLVSDGVMGGFICSLALLWLVNKERARSAMPVLILLYFSLLLAKVFVGNQLGVVEGFYGFKFHGLYVMFFFAGSYVIATAGETRRLLGFLSWALLITALYAVKQILFGFAGFEQKWLDSITFTTLFIEGVVRPFSTYASPATLSDGMSILIVTGFYWIIARGGHSAPFGMLLIASALWPLLIATVRTNWLATLAALAFYLGYLRIRKGWVKWCVLLLMIAGAAGIALRDGGDSGQAQAAAMSNKLNRKDRSLSEIMIRNRTSALANPLQEYSVQKRIQTWVYIWNQTLKFPFGVGQGTTGYAHSLYFQVLGETGFPGLLLFLSILLLSFRQGFRIIARSRDPAVAELARYMLTLLVLISILNLTGTHLHTPPGDLFFWFCVGCIHRFHRQMEEASAEGGPAALSDARAAAPGAAA